MEKIARTIRDLNGKTEGRNLVMGGYHFVNVEFPEEKFNEAVNRINSGLKELGVQDHVKVEVTKPEKPREKMRFLMIRAFSDKGREKIKEMMDAWHRLPKD